MKSFDVFIEDTGETYRCDEQRTVLSGMEGLGRRSIPVGCRGGGCGVCKVQITQGQVQRKAMSREHVTAEEEAEGLALACRIHPCSDLSLRVVGKMRKTLCRSDRAMPAGASIEVNGNNQGDKTWQ